MDAFAYGWTGDRFQRISARLTLLPDGNKLVSEGLSINIVSRDDLASMTAAMRVNPTASAFIAPGLLTYGHATEVDRIVHESHPDPAWREAYGPRWHHTGIMGCAWRREPGQRNAIVFVRSHPRELTATLYHELFHTIVGNLWEAEWEAVQAACDPLLKLNMALADDDPARKPGLWLAKPEEPAAWAFECFATGRPAPLGLRLPWRIRRIFKRIMAGKYADHRCAG